MSFKRTIFMMALMGLVAVGYSQGAGFRNDIALQLGLARVQNQDFLASPLQYPGLAFTAGVKFCRRSHTAFQGLGFNFTDGSIHSSNAGSLGGNSFSTDFLMPQLCYEYLACIKSFWNGRTQLYAGGGIQSRFIVRTYHYGRGLEDETIVEALSWVDPKLLLTYHWHDRTDFQFCVEGSTAGFTFRNPYSLSTDQLGAEGTYHSIVGAYLRLADLHSWRTFFTCQVSMEMRHAIGNRIFLIANYSFNYLKFNVPNSSVTVINNVSTQVAYRF